MGSQLLLRWDNHLPSFACSMKECLDDGDLTDLTISCQGRVLHCHKLVLSVASPHFKQLLKANPGQHPIVIMRDIPYKDISALLTFIYQGEVTVTEEDLPSFLKTAKALEVRGLADDAQPGGPAVSHAKQEARRAPHLEPEVVVKEEPCDQDEQEASRHDSSVAMTTVNDISLLQHGSPAANDRFPVGGSFEVRPAHLTPKTVSPCVVRLEKLDGGGGGDGSGGGGGVSVGVGGGCGGGGGSGSGSGSSEGVTHVVTPASGDPAAGNLDDMLIPGTSALLDRILRRQLSLPDRGYFCPYCTREVNMRTLGKHMTKIHGGMRLQCKACREAVHTRVTSLLINHGVCVLLLNKNAKLGAQVIGKLSRQIRSIYKNRRFKSQMLKRYPDLSYFCSSFIFGRVKQPCARCGLVLWSSSMASHLEKCGEDVIQCDFCNKHMARTRLPYHVDIYHPGKVIQQKVKPEAPPDGGGSPQALQHPVFGGGDESPASSQIVSCSKCHKKMRQNNLRRHMRVMHPWKPSMRFERRVDPATGLARRPVGEEHDPVVLGSDEEPLDDAEPEPQFEPVDDDDADATPAESADVDTKYAAYKRSCPVCAKVMWKKYLGSHVRSAHPDYEMDAELAAQLAPASRPAPPGSVSKAKVIKHCPYCWKTMWRCNVKRHIRQVHPEHTHKLTELFDLEAEIRAAALERGLPPPPSSDASSAGEEEPDDEPAAEASAQDEAMLAIQEMNAMAEAEGMEALEAEDEESVEAAMEESETVPTNSRRHEKNLKRCRHCRKLLRGCHLKRHMLNWHSPMATGKASTKTGVPGGLNPARQRTCPVCMKIVVVNNLRRHIRASHPEVTEEELMNVTDAVYPGGSGLFGADDASNDASLVDADDTSSSRSGPASSGGYAARRMRRCPHCAKVMVSSNMARHCKTHHPAEWRARHGGGPGRAAAADEAAREMEAMNAEEAAAWLDVSAGGGAGLDVASDGADELLDEAEPFDDVADDEELAAAEAALDEADDDLSDRLEIVDDRGDGSDAGDAAADALTLADEAADHMEMVEAVDAPVDGDESPAAADDDSDGEAAASGGAASPT